MVNEQNEVVLPPGTVSGAGVVRDASGNIKTENPSGTDSHGNDGERSR